MKRTLRTLLAAMMMAMPFVSSAQCDSVGRQIGDSLTSNATYLVPVSNFNRYSAVEMILEEYELGDPMTITAIGFYYASANTMTHATNVGIYLKNTSKSVFASNSDFEVVDGTATLVYSGPLNCTKGWNYFTLSYPYDYEGSGNLMMIVVDSSYGYDGSSYKFAYSTCQGYKTIRRYGDSQIPDITSANYGGSKDYFQYRPVMRLVGCEASGITCHMVGDLSATAVGADSVTLSWDAGIHGDAASYGIYRIDAPDTTRVATTTATTYTLTGLDANTSYTFAVRALCTANDSSKAAIVRVHTHCSVISSLPQTWTFEDEEMQGPMSNELLPWCWSRYTTGSGNYTYYPYCSATNTAYPHGGSRYLYFFPGGGATYPDTQAAVLPAVDVSLLPMNGNQISFWGRMNTLTGSALVHIGTMSDPTDISTFAFVDTVRVSGNTHNRYTVSLLPSPAGNPYVVLMVFRGTGGYLVIDDLTLEQLNGCPDVTALTVDSASASTISLSWAAADSIGCTLYNLDDNSIIDSNLTTHHYTVSGLAPSTTYSFGVQPNCPDRVADIVPITCHTECAVAHLPFYEGFENGGTYACWSTSGAVTGTGLTPGRASAGNWAFRFYYSENPPQYLFSPELEGADNGVVVEFDYAVADNTMPESFVIGYSTTTPTPSAFTWGTEQENVVNTDFARYSEVFYVPGIKYVAIKCTSNDQYYLYIDNLTLRNSSSCHSISDLRVDSVSTSSAFLSWTDTLNSGATYTLYEGSNWIASDITDTFFEIGGLEGSTVYTFTVVANCSDTNASDPVSVRAVTECENGSCNLTFQCYDSYMDGWGSCYISVNQLGMERGTVGCQLNNETYTVSVCSGSPVSLQWHGSVYGSQEAYFTVFDGTGDTAFSCVAGAPVNFPAAAPFATIASPCPDCLVPVVTIDSVTTSSISFSWTGDADSYDIYVNDTLLEATSVADNEYTLTGLESSMGYTIGVVALCSENLTSMMGRVRTITACEGDLCTITIVTGEYGLMGASLDVMQSGALIENFYDQSASVVTEVVAVCSERPVEIVYHESPQTMIPISFTVVDGSGATVYSYPVDGVLQDSLLVSIATPCPACQVPVPTLVELGRTTATISWSGEADGYDLYLDATLVQAGVTDTFFTFTDLAPNTTYTFGVVAACSANDTSAPGTLEVVTPCNAVTALPYSESFDFDLGCWRAVNGSADGMPWFHYFTTDEIPAHSGSGTAVSLSFSTPFSIHADTWLLSPQFVLPDTEDSLLFDWWFLVDSDYPDERYEVRLSTTGNDTTHFTTLLRDIRPTAANGQWTHQEIDLSAFAGRSVYLAFHHYDSYGNDFLALDDIELRQSAYVPPAPPMPDSLFVTYAVIGMGAITPAPGVYVAHVGDSVVATATAAEGYELSHWIYASEANGITLSYDSLAADSPVLAGVVSQQQVDDNASLTLTAVFRAITGIDGVSEGDVSIGIIDGNIVVRGAERLVVQVFDASGRYIAGTSSAASVSIFNVPAAGVYFVKVGSAPAIRVAVVR